MKRTLLLFTMLFISIAITKAQTTYDFVNNDNNTIYMDVGDILEAGNVIDTNVYTIVVCAPNGSVKHHLVLEFSAGLNIPEGSALCIYDGIGTSSSLITCYDVNNQSSPMAIMSSCSNVSGCLTLVLEVQTPDVSFSGIADYQFCCQEVQISLSTNPQMQGINNEINICQGDEIDFNLDVTFPDLAFLQNKGWGYNQNISTCTFNWDMGDSTTYTTQNVNHIYSQAEGYMPTVEVLDDSGCVASNSITTRVLISQSPNFSTISDSVICNNNNINLYGIIDTTLTIQNGEPLLHCDDIDLPDGTGITYSSTITYNDYPQGSLIQNITDIDGIFAELYHTYGADLLIQIECPNGQNVALHHDHGSMSGTNLGGGGGYGPCYEYVWSPTATNGCWNDQGIISDLPAGIYESEGDLSGLIGCPLNGTWTLYIQDTWASDEGHLCCWGINFDTTLFSERWSYENYYTAESWTTQSQGFSITSGGVGSENATAVYSGTSFPATGYFTYSVIDNFGCEYDTTISVVVDECTQVEDLLNKNKLSIYPNPAKDFIQIQSGENINSIEILSVDGKLVKQVAISNNSFNVSDLDKGIYYVKIGNRIQKFIKE